MSLEPNTRQPRSDVVGLDSGLEALQASPEFRGPVEPLDGHTCNDHLAHIYEDPAEQVATTVPYFREGIERGERCLYVVDRLSKDDVVGAMRDAGVDVDAALESGQLSFHTVDETYLRNGRFEPDEMIEFYGDVVDEATEEYSAVRVAAETTWLEDRSTSFEDFMEYEAKVNELFEGTDCIAICHYDRTALPPEVVRDVLRTHPHLIYDGTVCHNFYYTPPAEFFEPDEAGRDVERMLGTLLERSEAKTQLHERQQFLREQNEIVASPDRSFEEKLDRLLKLGCERFGLEIGMLTSEHEDVYEIDRLYGSHPDLDEGTTIPASTDDCCRHVISTDETGGVADLCAAGKAEDALYDEFGLRCFAGVQVNAGGDHYGTICFTDRSAREREFTESELTFLELMGEWVSQELARRERERRLERYKEYTDDILDAVDDVFYVLDEYGSLQRWNETAREVTGYDDAESSTMNALDFFADADEEAIAEGITEVFETGTGRVEAELQTRDGDVIPYEFVASALEDLDGNPVLTGIGRDVSERVARERAQHELYEITANRDLSFDEKVDRLLALGREHFDLDVGFFARVTDEEFEILQTVGHHAEIQEGATAPLSDTYCRRVVGSDGPTGVRDAAAEGWLDDPAHARFGLDAYFGTEVTVGGERFGTLCFAGSESRADPYSEGEYTFLELMSQWVGYERERERHEAQLATLNEMSRAITSAKTTDEVAEITVEYAEETLELPLTAVVTYDDHTGGLSPAAQTPGADDQLPTSVLCGREGGALWESFVAGEIRVLEDVASLPGAGNDITATLAVPLGQQGLFVTATTASDGFSDTSREVAETTAATVEAAFTRADREGQLQEREQLLEEQNETLERLNRVNDIIRDIDQALVQASTREEIEAVVCEQLADVGPYEMAWIGEHDAVTAEIVPVEWAGAEKGYLDEITVTSDDQQTGLGPAGRSIRLRESQVVNDVLQDDSFRPWRQEALNRSYHSCITLPLVYGETLYGVVIVYASQPGVFGELERTVLDELSDTIAHAINAVESKKALVSDEVTRLEFEVEDEQLEVLALARELDCSVSLESLVPRSDGGRRVFFSTRGAPAEDVLGFGSRLPTPGLSLVSESEDEGERVCLFEADLSEESLTETMLAHGGKPRTIEVEDGTARVTVQVAADAAVREFVEMFQRKYPDSELVAQRSLERPSRSPTEYRVSLTERLTDRQLEALQTAFMSGYFEQPRVQKGTDVAETLAVSQPTFTSHLRAAQRKLCEQLFE